MLLYAEQFKAIEVVGLREGYDDAQQNDEQTRQLLEQYRKWRAATTSAGPRTAWPAP